MVISRDDVNLHLRMVDGKYMFVYPPENFQLSIDDFRLGERSMQGVHKSDVVKKARR